MLKHHLDLKHPIFSHLHPFRSSLPFTTTPSFTAADNLMTNSMHFTSCLFAVCFLLSFPTMLESPNKMESECFCTDNFSFVTLLCRKQLFFLQNFNILILDGLIFLKFRFLTPSTTPECYCLHICESKDKVLQDNN